jgi:hypothetical protein
LNHHWLVALVAADFTYLNLCHDFPSILGDHDGSLGDRLLTHNHMMGSLQVTKSPWLSILK